jgi:glycosyltransferase involved in cell wall biosynthesis
VYVLNASTAGYTGTVAARFAGVPTVVRIAGDYAWEMAVLHGRTYLMIDEFQKAKKKGKTEWLHRMQTWVCHKADRIIVPSQYLAQLVAGWDIDTKKITVVYNGSDVTPSDLPKEEARKKVGVAGNIILSVGRLVPWKGFRMLIKVMPQLFQVNQFFRLVIVGDGPLMKELASIVRAQGLERKVFLVGRKNKKELAELMAAADVFVLNTGYEGFSHQLLEAMRAGVPVVTTTAGGNRELIEQGENGFMVRHNDEFNLVEAIKTLHRNEAMRRRFIESGHRTADRFSVERMLEETERILITN